MHKTQQKIRILSTVMALLGAAVCSVESVSFAANVVTTPARIGFSSKTVGFNAVNARAAGSSEFAEIIFIAADGTFNASVPIVVTSSNPASLKITQINPANALGNYQFSIPANAVNGTVTVTASANVGGVVYARARDFLITAGVVQAPPPAPVPVALANTTLRAATPTMNADQSGCATINNYDVGPGQTFTALSELPWSQLKGCDTVRIHAKANGGTYNEMMLISAGTDLAPTAPNKFMRVIGIPDPVTGALPIIDGTNATQLETLAGQAPRTLQYHDNGSGHALYKLGLVMVGPQSGYNYNNGPAGYIGIENLEIRNANYLGAFTDAKNNVAAAYSSFASCLYVEAAAHIVIKNNILHDCGNGLFMNSKNSTLVELSQDVLIEANTFYNNSNPPIAGVTNGYHEHSSYTEARDIIFQYNYFGDVKVGAFGDCLKDRSSGLIVRYNTFASTCGLQLNLMDSTGGQALIWGDAGYAKTEVYGNLFDRTPAAGQSTNLVLYGGDSGSTAQYRQGTLSFYNNTMVVKGDAAHGIYPETFLFNLQLKNAVADVRNNVFQATPVTAGAAGKIAVMAIGPGTVNMTTNWVSPNAAQFWVGHLNGAVINGWNTNLGSSNKPLFANEAMHDYRPAAGSPLVNAGAPLNGLANPTAQPGSALPGSITARKQDAVIDIGAFEY
jgi:hypothetical protein